MPLRYREIGRIEVYPHYRYLLETVVYYLQVSMLVRYFTLVVKRLLYDYAATSRVSKDIHAHTTHLPLTAGMFFRAVVGFLQCSCSQQRPLHRLQPLTCFCLSTAWISPTQCYPLATCFPRCSRFAAPRLTHCWAGHSCTSEVPH